MDALNRIEKLIARARGERPPSIDVADRVLWRIRVATASPAPVPIAPWGVLAGLSAVAASIILFLAINAWMALSNPMMELYRPVMVASLW
ncbi:MAG TPA: hypothetical protein ENN87_05595 [Phycisphaerales bacterium]|nr:hypothetical protein [Phycisphaerales bacterium]